jgi:hypothetical protein
MFAHEPILKIHKLFTAQTTYNSPIYYREQMQIYESAREKITHWASKQHNI